MENLSGDYDNAFAVTKESLFAGGGGHWVCVFHLCVSTAGGKSNKNDWRHFGY